MKYLIVHYEKRCGNKCNNTIWSFPCTRRETVNDNILYLSKLQVFTPHFIIYYVSSNSMYLVVEN